MDGFTDDFGGWLIDFTKWLIALYFLLIFLLGRTWGDWCSREWDVPWLIERLNGRKIDWQPVILLAGLIWLIHCHYK